MAPPLWAYQVDNFDPPPDEELVCSICRAVFCDPVQSPCNHVFCRNCIIKWLENSRNCPICRKRTTRFTLQEVVPLIRNMILKLTLRCHNLERGCEEKFTVEGCESHLKECVYEMIQCKNKPCKQMMLRKDIRDHELHNCSHRYIRCQKCGLKISTVGPQRHNCIKALKQCVKEKVEVIKKKTQKIKDLQKEIKTLKENEQENSETSSNDSISEADIMINLHDIPGFSSNSSSDSSSLVSDSDLEEDESFWMSTSDILDGLERRYSQRDGFASEDFQADDSIEYQRTSSPYPQDFLTSVNTSEPSFQDEPQVRRPAKRRHANRILDSSDDQGGDLELPSLPSPKRIWRLQPRDSAEASAQFTSDESSVLTVSALQDAGPSSVPSTSSVAAITHSAIAPVTSAAGSFKFQPWLTSSATEQTVSATATAVASRNGNGTFERTIALLEQYNLESDSEWLPSDPRQLENNTDSDSSARNHRPFMDVHTITSTDDSSDSDSDSSFDNAPTTAKLFENLFSSSDEDEDWQPN